MAKRIRIAFSELVLRRLEGRAQRAAVLDGVRHVAQVGLRGVVHERGEDVLDVAAPLLDEPGHDHRMLGDGVEDAAVAAEAALVGQGAGDVARVQLRGIGVERVDPATGDGLEVGTRSGRGGVGRGDATIVRHSYEPHAGGRRRAYGTRYNGSR